MNRTKHTYSRVSHTIVAMGVAFGAACSGRTDDPNGATLSDGSATDGGTDADAWPHESATAKAPDASDAGSSDADAWPHEGADVKAPDASDASEVDAPWVHEGPSVLDSGQP